MSERGSAPAAGGELGALSAQGTLRAGSGETFRFHPIAWLAWTGAALSIALLTQNPLYQTLLLLATWWVRRAIADESAVANPLWQWAWVIPLFTTVANGLTIHIGQTVLFRLPAWLPLIGGAITAEALAFGFVSGYALVTILSIFATFGQSADYSELVRMMPGFLFQAGLVVSIALAFVPQTLQALQDTREAQLIRGQRFRGWRDLPPLLLPVLTIGLERSIQLAEAMESRGFGGVAQRRVERAGSALGARLLVLGGLITFVVGLALVLMSAARLVGAAIVTMGTAMVAAALRHMGRRVRRSRYQPQPWLRRDKVLAIASLTLFVFLLGWSNLNPLLFQFYPYPRLSLPPFDPIAGVALMALALPAVLVPDRLRTQSEEQPIHETHF